jgi:hypothetical protein
MERALLWTVAAEMVGLVVVRRIADRKALVVRVAEIKPADPAGG